jgi:hypothetical protein
MINSQAKLNNINIMVPFQVNSTFGGETRKTNQPRSIRDADFSIKMVRNALDKARHCINDAMLSMLEQELLSLEREWTQVSNTFNDDEPESLFRFMGLLHDYKTHCVNFMTKIHNSKPMKENRGGTKTADTYAIDFTRGDINSLKYWLKDDFQALDLENFLKFVTVYVGMSFHGFDQMK